MRLHIDQMLQFAYSCRCCIGFRWLLAFQMELNAANYLPELVSVVRYLIFNIAAPAPLVRVCVALKGCHCTGSPNGANVRHPIQKRAMGEVIAIIAHTRRVVSKSPSPLL